MMLRLFLLIKLTFVISSFSAQKLKSIIERYPHSNLVKTNYTVLKKHKNIKHGTYQNLFENGQPELIGVYDHNRKTGNWKEFTYHGILRRVRTYDAGKLITDKKYGVWRETTPDGKLQYFDYDKNERVLPQIPIKINYPSSAREELISGTVKIKASLNKDCERTELTVVKSLRKDFDTEALKSVEDYIKKLKFYPLDCPGFSHVFTIRFKGD